MSNSVPFHVPIILSVHISLGVRYSPVSLIVPVTQYGVSYFRFLLHRTDPQLSVHTFLYGKHLDPYIRGFRQSVVDILTIDILWTPDVSSAYSTSTALSTAVFLHCFGRLPPTLSSSRPQPLQSEPVEVSEKAFQGVTPSFYLSNYQLLLTS